MKKLLITKRGSTSIIVTIFAMLLFSIIVVGFVASLFLKLAKLVILTFPNPPTIPHLLA